MRLNEVYTLSRWHQMDVVNWLTESGAKLSLKVISTQRWRQAHNPIGSLKAL